MGFLVGLGTAWDMGLGEDPQDEGCKPGRARLVAPGKVPQSPPRISALKFPAQPRVEIEGV